MNFFEAQERARRRTGRLVFLFVLAVIGTILACYAAGLIIFTWAGSRQHAGIPSLWDPALFAGTTGVVLAVVVCAMVFKRLQLSAGGPAVAEMLEGRRIQSGSAGADERRLLNIVEEMSIASGVPMPGVYVLDAEEGINAFAAGLGTDDAVVAVSRGALSTLSRDELQGVVAHEFSHILNGDMRLNMRMTCVLFGILVLGLIGRGLLEVMGRGRVRVGGNKEKGNGAAVLLAIGIALMIIGYVGYFFGRLIQSAVSRQREFLADASAVQFTRNPGGISGALMKIGGLEQGSALGASHAAELRHFFFAEATPSWLDSLFSTHPDLSTRIRAIDPSWDGRYVAPGPVRHSGGQGARTAQDEDTANPFDADQLATATTAAFAGGSTRHATRGDNEEARLPYVPAQVVESAGELAERHFAKARTLLSRMPETLLAAAREPRDCPTLLAALLITGQDAATPSVREPLDAATLTKLRPECATLARELRLPLVQVALGALRELPEQARREMLPQLETIIAGDGVTSPFEFALLAMVKRALTHAPGSGDVRNGIFSFNAVEDDLRVLLSALAWSGTADTGAATRALATGYSQIKLVETGAHLVPESECSAERLLSALERLGRASLPIRRRFLTAASHVVGSDGTITPTEAELLRGMALAVDCPLPLWDDAA